MDKLDYEFSSDIEVKGEERISLMHVMADGCKLDGLQALVEQHLKVTEKRDEQDQWNRSISYSGQMNDASYKVVLDWGSCPTLDHLEGHNVEVRSLVGKPDELSPIIAEEIKRYQAEATLRLQETERFVKDKLRR